MARNARHWTFVIITLLLVPAGMTACGDDIHILDAPTQLPSSLVLLSGNGQEMVTSSSAGAGLLLHVADQSGRGMAGVFIRFDGRHLFNGHTWTDYVTSLPGGTFGYSIPSSPDTGRVEVTITVPGQDIPPVHAWSRIVPREPVEPDPVWVRVRARLQTPFSLAPPAFGRASGFRYLRQEGSYLHGILGASNNSVMQLLCFDIGQPDAPALAWISPGLDASAAYFDGTHLYSIRNQELTVHALSTHGQLSPVGATASGDTRRAYYTSMAMAYPYLYLASLNGSDFREDLTVVDVSDPANPRWPTDPPAPGRPISAVQVEGNHLFVMRGSVGLDIMDITDPASPTLVSRLGTFGECRAVALAGDTLLVINAQGNASPASYDFSDPTDPRLLGIHSSSSHGGGDVALVEGNRLFVGSSSSCSVFDITDPATPVHIPGTLSVGEVSGLAFVGDRLVATHRLGLDSMLLAYSGEPRLRPSEPVARGLTGTR